LKPKEQPQKSRKEFNLTDKTDACMQRNVDVKTNAKWAYHLISKNLVLGLGIIHVKLWRIKKLESHHPKNKSFCF
jgi:hypothetical protein